MINFLSKYPKLRVQVENEVVGADATGKYRMIKSGRYAEFHDGEFKTKNMETIEALLNHKEYNRMFFGPFSREEVMNGSWKEEYQKMLKDQNTPADPREVSKPKLDALKSEIQKKVAAQRPKIIEDVRTTIDKTADDHKVVVAPSGVEDNK